MVDLAKLHAPLMHEFEVAFQRVVASGLYTVGAETEALEAELARIHKVKYVTAVSSGTDALICALLAYGVGRGWNVVVPAYTFFATVEAVLLVGATPVFVDVCEDSLCIDWNHVGSVMRAEHATPVVPVHLFGRYAGTHDTPRIEDAAQCVGAENLAGSPSRAACISFFPTKNIGALGNGGCVLTNDSAINANLHAIRVHGALNKYAHMVLGGNFRMGELQAALLRVKLAHLVEVNTKRKANSALYDTLLADCSQVKLLPKFGDDEIVHQYVLRAEKRDKLRSYLLAHDIETEVYFNMPASSQPALPTHLRAICPVAERAAKETLALPIHTGLEQEDIVRVTDAIKSFYYGA